VAISAPQRRQKRPAGNFCLCPLSVTLLPIALRWIDARPPGRHRSGRHRGHHPFSHCPEGYRQRRGCLAGQGVASCLPTTFMRRCDNPPAGPLVSRFRLYGVEKTVQEPGLGKTPTEKPLPSA
jgi:hypothetical protein